MNDNLDDMLMGHALDEARQALAKSHFPVGALLAAGERIVTTGQKAMGSNHLDHAEMIVFRKVFRGDYSFSRSDNLCLYTTLEPCIMCWGAVRHLPITRLVYAMDNPYGGVRARLGRCSSPAASRPPVVGPPRSSSRGSARTVQTIP